MNGGDPATSHALAYTSTLSIRSGNAATTLENKLSRHSRSLSRRIPITEVFPRSSWYEARLLGAPSLSRTQNTLGQKSRRRPFHGGRGEPRRRYRRSGNPARTCVCVGEGRRYEEFEFRRKCGEIRLERGAISRSAHRTGGRCRKIAGDSRYPTGFSVEFAKNHDCTRPERSNMLARGVDTFPSENRTETDFRSLASHFPPTAVTDHVARTRPRER